MEVKYYKHNTFVLCVANTGDYDIDSACIGMVGMGRSENSSYENLMMQIARRARILSDVSKVDHV